MLHLAGIHKRFGRLKVIDGLSLHLARGEIYGLLGPSGSGKSTTLKIITGLVRPDRGVVSIEGVDCRTQPGLARRLVGAQIEVPAFPGHLTVRQSLSRLAELQSAPRDQAEQLLQLVDLRDQANYRVREISSGLRQRLGLAAALLGTPDLLVLDEPTSGLDPQGREALLSLIRRVAGEQELTVLFTSHVFAEVADLGDRVGMLVNGRLVHEGLARPERLLREMYFDVTGRKESA